MRWNGNVGFSFKGKWFNLFFVQQMIDIGNEVKRGLKFDSDTDKKIIFLRKQYNILN